MLHDQSEADLALILDIWRAGCAIVNFTRDVTLDDFLSDEEKQSAVILKIIIMGEATKKLSDEFKEAHPEVPWHQIYGMRNRLIHDYSEIKLSKVWDAASQDVPAMITYLAPLVPSEN